MRRPRSPIGAGRWRGWWLVLACCLLLLSLTKASVDSGSESGADLSPTTSSAGLSDGGDVELLLEEGEEEGGEEAVVEREEPVLIVATVVRACLPISTTHYYHSVRSTSVSFTHQGDRYEDCVAGHQGLGSPSPAQPLHARSPVYVTSAFHAHIIFSQARRFIQPS